MTKLVPSNLQAMLDARHQPKAAGTASESRTQYTGQRDIAAQLDLRQRAATFGGTGKLSPRTMKYPRA